MSDQSRNRLQMLQLAAFNVVNNGSKPPNALVNLLKKRHSTDYFIFTELRHGCDQCELILWSPQSRYR